MAHWDRITAVYIVANRKNGALYTGVTSHLIQRIHQHKQGVADGYTKRYGCKNLVWYELHEDIREAIRREKSLKSYRRQNKINMIVKNNPHWSDLYFSLL
ncbi:GIY-YIG nuclease family protein [Hirschia baltica]|uniref:Excinuclease ABC C subunit domain protein n=1 Tax=Hirschia baltica (strain ATCC 49814 / DSM 5838 / IFAM 1418) TaxID=582402 RepID=C6XMH9_HIRBI|nr:GIY-YIG nuclease family protein [Hirschia baltica]ACT58122.1 Excinuclease ABC C subunit domain protein [Hirschia baltica ATCC 49814]